MLPDYLNEFSYTILAKSQMKNELVSEIILMLIPPGDRRTKNKKSKKLNKVKLLRCLLDSGSTGNVLAGKHVETYHKTKTVNKTWRTASGVFKTKEELKIKTTMSEFSESKEISMNFNVHTGKLGPYDAIIGRRTMQDMGIILNFKQNVITWDGMDVAMKNPNELADKENLFATFLRATEPELVQESTDRANRILDANYEKANLASIVKEQCSHLTKEEKNALLRLLLSYEDLFDGTLGDWQTEPIKFQLKPGATPYHGRAYPIPKIHEETLKKEIQRLIELGVLERCGASEWASPSFIIPKPNGTVRFLTDMRQVNKRIVRRPFPLPKINDMMQKLEGFRFASALDLNMGYYTLRLDPHSQDICTIILPWGKYKYKRLPMGMSCSPDIFQDKMSELFEDLEYARTYIDDLLCLSKSSLKDHLSKLETMLIRLRQKGLKINAKKSSFCQTQIEYLGYLITRDGIKPLDKKVQAILQLDKPKNLRELRRILGMVQYYRDIWEKRSHTLAPLTDLVGELGTGSTLNKNGKRKRDSKKFTWRQEHEIAFKDLKKMIAREIILAYPDFNKKFVIYTDASDRQLGGVITQDNMPLALYSRKLNSAQMNYTVTEKELLSIVETLKEFQGILLGREIDVFTDHKNLVYETTNMTSQRCLRWRIMLEEFGPTLQYIKGEENTVADAISRLDRAAPDSEEAVIMEEVLSITEDSYEFPLELELIAAEQAVCNTLAERRSLKPDSYISKTIGGVEGIICKNDKIVVPETLQQRVMDWYHHRLKHPGETRMEKTISQYLTWHGLTTHVRRYCKRCPQCQMAKRLRRNYGHVPPKNAEFIPWKSVCVDCIGPYKVKHKKKKGKWTFVDFHCLTMIDPATGWIELAPIPQQSELNTSITSKLFDEFWLNRYPRAQEIIYDNGSEFKKHFKRLCQDFGLKRKPTTVKNPQANAIVERVHGTLNTMLRTENLDEKDLDKYDPFGEICSNLCWAIRSSYHTTLKATPGQLIFGRDMVLDVEHISDLFSLRKQKQIKIDAANKRENAKRVDYDWQVGDLCLIKKDYHGEIIRKVEFPNEGPYKIIQVHTNGTVRIQRGKVTERINIRRLRLFNK